MNRIRIVAYACLAVVGLLATHLPAAEIGRYQLAVGTDGDIVVIDTTTGQCWSKGPGRAWVDHGIPSKTEPNKPREPLSLKLPEERVKLTLSQRHEKVLPGSQDRIFLHLGDITGGQVEVSIKTDDGKTLLDDTSMERGDVADFRVGKKTFYLRLRELKNFLVGEDLAILELSAIQPTDESAQKSPESENRETRREKKKSKKTEPSQENSAEPRSNEGTEKNF